MQDDLVTRSELIAKGWLREAIDDLSIKQLAELSSRLDEIVALLNQWGGQAVPTVQPEVAVTDQRLAPVLSDCIARGGHCSLLLIEVDDGDRFEVTETQEELIELSQQVREALGKSVEPGWTLVPDGRWRYWLVIPEAIDRPLDLATRLNSAVAAKASLRGEPPKLSVGVADFPSCQTAEELREQAETNVLSARSRGLTLVEDGS